MALVFTSQGAFHLKRQRDAKPLFGEVMRTRTLAVAAATALAMVVGSNRNFIVTSAANATGQTVFDIPGHRNRAGIVTCAVRTPAGKDYTFQGFFTPA
jgi:hypothetical protein